MLLAREVRERLKGRCDPQISFCLEALAEQAIVREQALTLMAETLDKLIDNLMIVQQMQGGLTKVMDKLKGIKGESDDESSPTI